MSFCLCLCGIFWIASGMINNTKNIQSAIFYRIIPVITGVFALCAGIITMFN